MNINFVLVSKYYLHGKYSGYNQIIDYFDEKDVVTLDRRMEGPIFNVLPDSMFAKLAGMEWYTKNSLLVELKLARRLIKEGSRVYHHIYGEDSYRFSKNFDFKDNKILCTFHQPPGLFERYVKSRDHLKKLDGIIALSSDQKDYFKKYLDADKIFHVPHGVDTNFFTAKKNRNLKKNTCICVGDWQRDFKTLREVIKLTEKDEVFFKVVTTEKNFRYFEGLKNVELMCKLSDQELLNQYQDSDVFLFPLIDCAANNALLEAMACGLPVVCSDVGGTTDYVDESCAVLVKKGDAATMADETLSLLKDDATLKKMGEKSRKRSDDFKWENVTNKIKAVYESFY